MPGWGNSKNSYSYLHIIASDTACFDATARKPKISLRQRDISQIVQTPIPEARQARTSWTSSHGHVIGESDRKTRLLTSSKRRISVRYANRRTVGKILSVQESQFPRACKQCLPDVCQCCFYLLDRY